MSILRDYQRAAITAAWETISPEVNRVAIEMATGLGKTITFAALLDEWLDRHKAYKNVAWTTRALVLVHTDELVRQAVDKIRFVAKSQPWTIGVVKAAQNEVDADIIVASVQTLANPSRREQIQDVGLIIVDEAHHAVATTYQAILEHYGATSRHDSGEVCSHCPHGVGYTGIPVFGFTATLGRTDGKGLGVVWQDLAFSRSLPWAIRKGWLVDLIPYTIKIPGIDAGSSDVALDSALADSIAPEAIVQAWMDHAHENGSRSDAAGFTDPSTVLFAPLVRSAEAFAAAFQDAGVKAEVVHGGLPAAERQAILGRYEDGTTAVICNAMVLTEGWDSPRTKCVIVARPTQSVPLFVQMVGRGLRPWLSPEAPPRADQRCVLLCVAGTTTDLATVADLSDKVDEAKDGKSLLEMEDEFDIGAELDIKDEDMAYRGPVRVEQWDALVQESSKAWKFTDGGAPFLPFTKRNAGYVFIVQSGEESQVWARKDRRVSKVSTAPDLELAMAAAEDFVQDAGGDIGSLLADKTRPWRKAVPSLEMVSTARRVGVDERDIQAILKSKASGKAGKLSDLIDKVVATRVLDHLVAKIRERGN